MVKEIVTHGTLGRSRRASTLIIVALVRRGYVELLLKINYGRSGLQKSYCYVHRVFIQICHGQFSARMTSCVVGSTLSKPAIFQSGYQWSLLWIVSTSS